MTTESMPPLPEPSYAAGLAGMLGENCFTAAQMHAYAQAYAAQEVAKERDCRTCVSFSGFTCSAALRCIDGSSYRALVPIQAWERAVPNPGF